MRFVLTLPLVPRAPGSGVGSLLILCSAQSSSIDLLTAINKIFLFSVPQLIVAAKNLGYVPGKLLM